MAGFELLFEGKANDVIPVYKYRSSATGLTVVLAQVDGPLVNGYFCLATEAHDDDGLPHTLEHLIFLGSEKYPYKGVLDLLANRCLASGTNAWTDTDHTCYTMTTAGSEGFLNLMPVYLDHVLYPTLTESGYITEVHHINGDGEDAGVVYCEMQGRENTGESRTHIEMLRGLYPGHCGYKSETGGIMSNLRESTSHQKVCDYHQEYYRPENLCLIVTGQVQPEQLFKVLKPFEEKILSKHERPPHVRPWQSKVPALEESVVKVVPYASDDEENGMVEIAWRGPPCKDQYAVTSMLILMEYLTDTAVAPLQRDFVEIDDPYCSMVGYSIIENMDTCVYLNFQNVPKDKLEMVKDRLDLLLEGLGSQKEKIDMNRMETVIHRRVLEAMSALEDSPHDALAFMAIGDFLYGDSKQDLEVRINQISSFRKLKTESQEYWVNLVKKYLVGTNSIIIIGDPSKKVMKEQGDAEKARVLQQRKALGEDGLKMKAGVLTKANEENEVEPPEHMLTFVDVPDVGCIHFHPIHASSNHDIHLPAAAAGDADKFPIQNLPVSFDLDDIQTNFVCVNVLMNTADVPRDLKFFLPLFLEVILESPMERDGVVVPYEEVVAQLAADSLACESAIGLNGGRYRPGGFSQLAVLSLKVEVEKYDKCVSWLRELLHQSKFTVERVRIIATKMVNDVAQLKRSGRTVVKTLMKDMLYTTDSNSHISGMMRQHKFLSGLLKQLEGSQAQQVLDSLSKLRDLLTKPDNLQVHMAAHTDTLAQKAKPQLPWLEQFLPKGAAPAKSSKKVARDQSHLRLKEVGPGQNLIVGVGSVESSFLHQIIPLDLEYQDPDLASLMVYIQYLTQLEGPMWKQIRGLGLAYHYNMYPDLDAGLLYFVLFKCTHVVKAYTQAKEILDGFLSGKTKMNIVELESAKSSLIFEVIEEEKTPSEASQQSLLASLRGLDKGYNRYLIAEIAKVTLDDLQRVGKKYFPAIFDPAIARAAICCHPTKVQEVKEGFKKLSRELTVVSSLEDSFLSETGLNV